jgi:hypothetical protein
MNRVAQPVPPNDEALDALLGAFFKAEMPAEWPAFQPPRPRVLPFRPAAPPAKRRGFFLSRVALAASVALLLLAAWLMPRGPLSSTADPTKFRTGAPTAGDKAPPIPEIFPVPDDKDKKASEKGGPDNVKSSLRLEQKDGRGTIRIDVEELPPGK